ncbi:MAG: hypothetical protein RI894_344 [Bacteroidota bacterium]|jgi:hypothetical protein
MQKRLFATSLVIVFLAISLDAKAQTNNEAWEVTITLPYHTDIPQMGNEYGRLAEGTTILKYNKTEEQDNDSFYAPFRSRIFELIKQKKLPCFYDEGLTKPIETPLDSLFSFRNIYDATCATGIDLEAFSQLIFEKSAKIPLQYGYPITMFLVKQQFNYDPKTRKITSKIKAIAPACLKAPKWKYAYESDDFKPIFWIKLPTFKNAFSLDDCSNTYAIRTVQGYLFDTIRINKQKVGDCIKQIKTTCIENLKTATAPIIYATNEEKEPYYTHKKLSIAEMIALYSPPNDTIIEYTPDDTEITKVVPHLPLDRDTNVNGIKLLQTLLFDAETGAIGFTNNEIAICKQIIDSKFSFRFQKSLFFYPFYQD